MIMCQTRLTWSALAKLLKPVSGSSRALVMATCSGGDRQLTQALIEGDFVYRRWDGTEYLRYPSNASPNITHLCGM